MAAVLAEGTTVIDNAAREPEIVDICTMLQAMGARIDGVGTSTLEIEGVDSLSPVEHVTVPDRLVAGTWAVAAVMTRGDVTVHRGRADHLEIALDKLVCAGAQVDELDDGFRVRCNERPRAVDVVTLPYPGFPTDLQPQFIALNVDRARAPRWSPRTCSRRASASSTRWCGSAPTSAPTATTRWCAARSRFGRARRGRRHPGGRGLVLAGLVADGVTTVYEPHHVDRGYEGFIDDLVRLGADVTRVQVNQLA